MYHVNRDVFIILRLIWYSPRSSKQSITRKCKPCSISYLNTFLFIYSVYMWFRWWIIDVLKHIDTSKYRNKYIYQLIKIYLSLSRAGNSSDRTRNLWPSIYKKPAIFWAQVHGNFWKNHKSYNISQFQPIPQDIVLVPF